MIVAIRLMLTKNKNCSYGFSTSNSNYLNLNLNLDLNLNDSNRSRLLMCSNWKRYATPIGTNEFDKKDEEKEYNWKTPMLAIALPALIGMMADPLLSLIDTIFVGKLALSSSKLIKGGGGAIELASLGACSSIFHLAFNTFKATTSVTTSLVSSAIASDGDEGSALAKEVTVTSLMFAVVMGVFVAVMLTRFSNPVLRAMGVGISSEMYAPAVTYLKLRALAAPAVLLITVCEGAFRGRGDTKIPLLASAVAAVGNLVLDPLLMFGPTLTFTALSMFGLSLSPVALRYGIGGAAIATAAR